MIRNEEWSTMRRLLLMHGAMGAPLKEYEVDGNPAVFQTNVAKPLAGFTIPFLPVQAGSGDPSLQNQRPISGWSGVTAWRTGKNLFDEAYPGIDENMHREYVFVGNNEVTISTTCPVTGLGSALLFIQTGQATGGESTSGNGVASYQPRTVTPTNGFVTVSYRIQGGIDPRNYETMLNFGSTASPYAEYTGQSYPVTFPATGKNLLTSETLTKVGNSYYICGGNTDYPIHLAAGTYTISNAGQAAYQYLKSSDGSVQLQIHADNKTSGTFTLETDMDCQIWFYKANASETDFYNIMLNTGETALPYEPYTNTVYGGTLDAVNGVLTVEWKSITETWGNFLNKTSLGDNTRGTLSIAAYPSKAVGSAADAKCNIAPRGTGWSTDSVHFYTNEGSCIVFLPNDTDASTEIQVVYPLATPIEIHLDPITVQTLIGDNTIWTDANGENTIRYKKKG